VRLAIVVALVSTTAFADPPRYTRSQRIPPAVAKPHVMVATPRPSLSLDDLPVSGFFVDPPPSRRDDGPDDQLRAARTYTELFRLWRLEAESLR
jgi:hypothetical protein